MIQVSTKTIQAISDVGLINEELIDIGVQKLDLGMI